jgi:hypothetical protein
MPSLLQMSNLLADLAVFDCQSAIPPSRYFPLSAIYSGKLLKAFNKSGSLKLIHFFLLQVYPPFFKLQHLSLSLPPIFDLYLVFPGSRTFRYTTLTYHCCFPHRSWLPPPLAHRILPYASTSATVLRSNPLKQHLYVPESFHFWPNPLS